MQSILDNTPTFNNLKCIYFLVIPKDILYCSKCNNEICIECNEYDYEKNKHGTIHLEGYVTCTDCYIKEIELTQFNITKIDSDTIKKMVNKNYFENTYNLEIELNNILSEFFKENYNKLSKYLIWKDTFYESIFLTMCTLANTISILEKIAYDIYISSLELNIRGDETIHNSDTDMKCAIKILENKKISNTILIMGYLIKNNYLIMRNIASSMSKITNLKFKQHKYWEISRLLSHNINNYKTILNKYNIDTKYINIIVNNDSIINNLTKMNEHYNTNFNLITN